MGRAAVIREACNNRFCAPDHNRDCSDGDFTAIARITGIERCTALLSPRILRLKTQIN